MAETTLLRTFRFQIHLRRSAAGELGNAALATPDATASGEPLGDGGFQECSGLQVEMDVQEYLEGGRNDGVVQRAGRANYTDIVLKRGMFLDADGSVNRHLWEWLQQAVAGKRPLVRYDGVIEVLSRGETVAATWVFDRGLPKRISGPQLNAKTGEVAIEELTIAHEGLRLEV